MPLTQDDVPLREMWKSSQSRPPVRRLVVAHNPSDPRVVVIVNEELRPRAIVTRRILVLHECRRHINEAGS
jgi:hypothetical protein